MIEHDFVFADSMILFLHGAVLLLTYLIFAGILSHRFHLNFWQRRICRFLGDISYPLYLLHFAAFSLVAPYSRNGFVMVLAALSLSTAVYFCCDFYSFRRKLT